MDIQDSFDNFQLPSALRSLLLEHEQQTLKDKILEIHVRLKKRDPELENNRSRGYHLWLVFDAIAIRLQHQPNFKESLVLTDIPEFIEQIRSDLMWYPHNAGDLRPHFLAPCITQWRNAQAGTSILAGQHQLGAVAPANKVPQERVETFLDAHHPKFMYHATKPPIQVFSRKEIEELGPEWSETYIYKEYPKCKYHRTGKSLVVKDASEEAALGEGWGDSSVGPFGLTDADPLRWFDTWDLGALNSQARSRIRAGLAKAHADIIESGADRESNVRRAAMRKLFDVFALEYLAADLLTESIMAQTILQMVYDTAVSGGWQTGALSPNGSCTLQFGHYWVPSNVPAMLADLFQAQVWRWRAELEGRLHSPEPVLELSLPPIKGESPRADSPRQVDRKREEIEQRAARRQAVVNPILEEKGWKSGRLVTESGVGKATVYGYLDGSRAWIESDNRQAIADCLGLESEDLPE